MQYGRKKEKQILRPANDGFSMIHCYHHRGGDTWNGKYNNKMIYDTHSNLVCTRNELIQQIQGVMTCICFGNLTLVMTINASPKFCDTQKKKL